MYVRYDRLQIHPIVYVVKSENDKRLPKTFDTVCMCEVVEIKSAIPTQ